MSGPKPDFGQLGGPVRELVEEVLAELDPDRPAREVWSGLPTDAATGILRDALREAAARNGAAFVSEGDPETNAAFEGVVMDKAERAAADAEDRGHEGRELPPPNDPMAVARVIAAESFTDSEGDLILRYWRGGWWHWRTTRWTEWELRAVQQAAYEFTEHAIYLEKTKQGPVATPWRPNRHRIGDLLEALSAVCLLPESVSQPTWIGDKVLDGSIVACANGLLDVGTRTLYAHTPR
jgi:hypothetical protein